MSEESEVEDEAITHAVSSSTKQSEELADFRLKDNKAKNKISNQIKQPN